MGQVIPRNSQTNAMAILFVVVSILAPMSARANSAPEISNIVVLQRDDSFLVDITYDLMDPDDDPMWVYMLFMPYGVSTGAKPCEIISGDVGPYVYSGLGLNAVWDSGEDYPDLISDTCKSRIMGSDLPPFP